LPEVANLRIFSHGEVGAFGAVLLVEVVLAVFGGAAVFEAIYTQKISISDIEKAL
jgi:hypothetical protein